MKIVRYLKDYIRQDESLYRFYNSQYIVSKRRFLLVVKNSLGFSSYVLNRATDDMFRKLAESINKIIKRLSK